MRTLKTVEELDQAMAECDAAVKVSDDRLREVFDTFEMKPDFSDMPDDPTSDEYFDWQMALYEKNQRPKILYGERSK